MIPPCLAFVDAAGDSSLEDSGQLADPTLDITRVSLAVRGKAFSAKVQVAKWAEQSSYSTGNRFDVYFTVGGKEITLFADRAALAAVEGQAFALQGIKVDGAYVSGTSAVVTSKVTGNALSIDVSTDDLSAALGASVAGKVMSMPRAVAWGYYDAVSLPYDNAVDGSKTARVVTCK